VRVGAQITNFDVDPTGAWLAVGAGGAADGTVRLFDLRRLVRLHDEGLPVELGPPVDAPVDVGTVSAMSVNGAGAIAVADDAGRICWLPRGARAAVVLGAHEARVRGLLAGPDGILSADADGEIRLWRVPAGGGGDGR
jgi:WD40 repeat protein